MSAEAIGTLVLAAVAIVGAIGSVLALAFRVGRLTGTVESALEALRGDRADDQADMKETRAMITTHLVAHAASSRR